MNGYDPIRVGEMIRAIRQELGLSMEEFAKRIDNTAKSGTVSNWETGKNLPNLARLNRIAELGGVSKTYLLGIAPHETLDTIDQASYKLMPLGYELKEDLSEGYLWMECPDNTSFEVSLTEISNLNSEIDSFSRFKVEELKKNHEDDIRKN